MAINVTSSFYVQTNLPLDGKFIKADDTARDAIPAGERYQGLLVYVTSTKKMWQLQGGITNSDWVLAGGGGGGISAMDTTARNALPYAQGQTIYNTDTNKLETNQNTGRWGQVTTKNYSSQIALVNSDSVSLNIYDFDQEILVQGNSGAVTIDGTAPFLYSGTKPHGLRVTLIGGDDTKTVTLPANDTNNTIKGIPVTLKKGSRAVYTWDSSITRFVLTYFSATGSSVGSSGGGFSNIVTKTASATILANEDCILVNAASGSVVLTLPPMATGEPHNIKRIDSVEANTVTIQRAGSDTIDGQTSITLPYQYSTVKLVGIATNLWGLF